jgi:D-arabinose 1-dehydrogenase-like Zn-dependent alcohol dehydrogenase
MKAALIESFNGPVDVREVAEPKCSPHGAIVAVRACGVCRSDHHAWKGADPDVELPHVMGHELAGDVLKVGAECRQFTVGDRVTAPFILGCGSCPDCRSGQSTVCAQQAVIGFTYWGAFAERVTIPHADYNLVRLPQNLDYVEAAGMGCRVTTAWRALTDRARLEPGEWVVVYGSGGVGLSVVVLAASLGARVLAVDISEDALELARKMGATVTLNAASSDRVWQQVRDLTDGGGEVSVDALGTATTFENSLRSLRKLGRHVQVGMPVGNHTTVPLALLELVYSRQLSIIGMRGLGSAGFAPLLNMISAGRVDLSDLVTRRVALSQVHDVLSEMDGRQRAGVTVVDRFES